MMRQRQVKRSQNPEPLRAFGADGQVVALSYDGGKTWSAVPQPSEPVVRTFTRRLVAIASPVDPWCSRRIIPVFSHLWRARIFAGWGPAGEVLTSLANADALVLPLSMITPELLNEIAGHDRSKLKLILDVPTPVTDASALATMTDALKLVDVVLVPTDAIALQMKRIHQHVMTLPPVLAEPLPAPPVRRAEAQQPLTIAVQPTQAPGVHQALTYLKDRYGDRITVIEDNWLLRLAEDAPAFYQHVDIVIAGPPAWPEQVSIAPILEPMASACCLVVDKAFGKGVRDGVNGRVVPKADYMSWRRILVSVIDDWRLRLHLMRGARSGAARHTVLTRFGTVSRPFRLAIPEGEEFTVPVISTTES